MQCQGRGIPTGTGIASFRFIFCTIRVRGAPSFEATLSFNEKRSCDAHPDFRWELAILLRNSGQTCPTNYTLPGGNNRIRSGSGLS
jgi:hypothetical protein